MTKRQIIDEIIAINPSGRGSFLARFDEADLAEYLVQLQNSRIQQLRGDGSRFGKYFGPAVSVDIPPAKAGRYEPVKPAEYQPREVGFDCDSEVGQLERAALTSSANDSRPETPALAPMTRELVPVAVGADFADSSSVKSSFEEKKTWLFRSPA